MHINKLFSYTSQLKLNVFHKLSIIIYELAVFHCENHTDPSAINLNS